MNNENGPPRRPVTKSAATLTADILKCKVPTYYDTKKAWSVLGYHRTPKPLIQDFVPQVNALWGHQAQLRTLKGRRARAYMLDALRTLGFRNGTWNVNVRDLGLDEGDQDGSWASIAGPGMGGRGIWVSDARLYVGATAPRAAPRERGSRDRVEIAMWRDLHRYQGFRVQGPGPERLEFHVRAFPVPKGADSLWHSVS